MTATAKVYGLRRHCFCCGEEHEQPSTVECAAHGPMEMDWPADGFRCPAGDCAAFLPLDEWWARLRTDPAECAPVAHGSPEPVLLTVTP